MDDFRTDNKQQGKGVVRIIRQSEMRIIWQYERGIASHGRDCNWHDICMQHFIDMIFNKGACKSGWLNLLLRLRPPNS
jgi:hypothetical protein